MSATIIINEVRAPKLYSTVIVGFSKYLGETLTSTVQFLRNPAWLLVKQINLGLVYVE